MSIVPYRDTRRRRERLDRPRVVRAAMALLDEVGLDGLTTRHLAERLGIKPASLYRHVRDKQELLVLLADEISGEIPVVGSDPPWQERLVEMAQNVRRVLLTHRDAARLLARTGMPSGPHRLRHVEALLSLLLSAGFPPWEATRAAYHFNNYVTEFVADETLLAETLEARGISSSEAIAEAREQLRALPADEYPNLTRFADYVADNDIEGSFQFGLQILIAGLEKLRRL